MYAYAAGGRVAAGMSVGCANSNRRCANTQTTERAGPTRENGTIANEPLNRRCKSVGENNLKTLKTWKI